MKKNHLAAIAAALALMTLPFASCGDGQDQTVDSETDTEAVVTIPPITVPTEPDERVPTDLAFYTNHVKGLFDGAVASPAEDFTYETSADGTVTITGYVGDASAAEESSDIEVIVVIPDTIDGMKVTAIAEGAFADHAAINRISVPDGVTSIGFGAFKGCKGLHSMRTPVFTCEDAPYFGALFGAETFEANGYQVPVSLTTLVLTSGEIIPDCAFYACRNLKVIALPASVVEISNFAFYDCSSLEYVSTADTRLTSIGQNAFTGCEALLSLDVPATTETLGFAMLEGCGKLESITLPFVGGASSAEAADTAYLGYIFGASDYTFTEGFIPASLIEVTLLEGCGDIAPNAFFSCSSIREINLPDGVTAIGRRAFYGCEGLAEMSLPDTVTAIGDDAFHGCIRLTSFNGGAGLGMLGIQTFMDCVSLKNVTLPDTVTHLPNSCFAGCVSLESLTANGVRTQGSQVFRHCDKLTGWNPAS